MKNNEHAGPAFAAVSAAATKISLSFAQTAVLGFLAGAYISMGGSFMLVVVQDAAQYVGVGISKAIGGLVFSLGLFLVVAARGELFTGNCLMAKALLAGHIRWSAMMRNLVIVYFANLAGAVFFARMLSWSGVLSLDAASGAVALAEMKTSLPTFQLIVRGVLCNWFVALAVWLTFGAEGHAAKLASLMLPISAFTAIGFEHSIANMFFIPLAIFLKESVAPASPLCAAAFIRNILPVTFGNVLGAVIFVAGLYFIVYRKELTEDFEL